MPLTEDTPINRNTPYRTDIGMYCKQKICTKTHDFNDHFTHV